MNRRFNNLWLVIAVVLPMVLAACSGGTGSSTSASASASAASQAPEASGSTAASASELPGTKSFKVAVESPGVSTVAILAAIDDLNAQGYQVETPQVADPNLIMQGIGQGQFDFSSGSSASALIAIDKGAPVKIIGDRVGNEWELVSISSITDCAGLDGKRLAHHSETAVGTVMERNWLAQTCPGTKPNELIIAGSDNRANALKAGQVDASELELSDGISLFATEGDKFHVLTSFAKTLPDLKPSTIYGSSDFMSKNPGTTVAFLKAILEENRKISKDADYLKQLVLKYIPNVNQDTLDEVTKQYVELGLFEPDGGLTESSLEYTINFFADAGSVSKDLTPDKAGDLSYLQTALEQLGG